MEQFYTVIRNRTIVIRDSASAVQFSFLVQNSLSYLDLHVYKQSNIQNSSRSTFEISSEFVNTAEKCRKVFIPSRNILYTLHLDMPLGRETSLREDAPPFADNNCESSVPHIAKVEIRELHNYLLTSMIEHAIRVTNGSLETLRMVLKCRILKRLFSNIDFELQKKFMDFFYPNISEPFLFKGYIEILNTTDWICKYEQPDIIEFLLYHMRANKINLADVLMPAFNDCLDSWFLNIRPCLKYIDTPQFDEYFYVEGCKEILPDFYFELDDLIFEEAESKWGQERLHFILQFLWIYKEIIDPWNHLERPGITENATEALYAIWSSTPQHYITIKELEFLFGFNLPESKLKDMYYFYCNSIDANPLENAEPRSLKHLSRTVIRRTLKENEIWIPDGIRQMKLPKSLQAYLNLERFVPIVICDINIDE